MSQECYLGKPFSHVILYHIAVSLFHLIFFCKFFLLTYNQDDIHLSNEMRETQSKLLHANFK